MTPPVKVCRATSASVIRGPPSHRGRETTLLPLVKFRCEEIAKTFRSQHIWLCGKGAIFQCTRITSLMKTDNFYYQERFSHWGWNWFGSHRAPWEKHQELHPSTGRLLLRLHWQLHSSYTECRKLSLSGLNLVAPISMMSINTVNLKKKKMHLRFYRRSVCDI